MGEILLAGQNILYPCVLQNLFATVYFDIGSKCDSCLNSRVHAIVYLNIRLNPKSGFLSEVTTCSTCLKGLLP